MFVSQRLKENKTYQKYVGMYGEDVTNKYTLPLVYDVVSTSLNVTRKMLGKTEKKAFSFRYLPNEVDIAKGRIRLRKNVVERIRLFYSFRAACGKHIPVFMNENVREGRYVDTGKHVFFFHEHIKLLKNYDELEVIVGFRGVELRVA